MSCSRSFAIFLSSPTPTVSCGEPCVLYRAAISATLLADLRSTSATAGGRVWLGGRAFLAKPIETLRKAPYGDDSGVAKLP